MSVLGPELLAEIRSPLRLMRFLWPDADPYAKQIEIMESVDRDDETYVPAGNMLGKDWIAGRIIVSAFLTRSPCRIVTTSAKEDHLRVLWGEINSAILSAKFPLDSKRGGPLIVNHHELRKTVSNRRCPISYVRGMVAGPDSIAAMQGHHVASQGDGIWRTLFVVDEASSVPDEYKAKAQTWANRMLIIGNTWPCENFFKHAVKGKPGTDDRGGDIPRDQRDLSRGYYRKVIHIKATDSPNVRLGLLEVERGRTPSNTMVVPGVKSWEEYQKNLALWDDQQKTVSLDAEFYEGRGVMLFPKEWLERSQDASLCNIAQSATVESIGIDPGEGSANTVMVAISRYGVKEMVSKKTPDTSIIVNEAVAFMKKHGVHPSRVVFDRGGGGKQHADRLRAMGYPVRTVAFGESVSLDPRRGLNPLSERKDNKEERYVYVNRRAEMYGQLSILLDPSAGPLSLGLRGINRLPDPQGFGIPKSYYEVHRQLSPIPLWRDPEGRLFLPSKNRKPGSDTKTITLQEIIGNSPDEADALAAAIHGLLYRSTKTQVGALV